MNLIDRSKYLKNQQNKEFINMIKSEIEKEINSTFSGCKKQYTPNQIINLYKTLYNRIAYNLELKDKFSEGGKKSNE